MIRKTALARGALLTIALSLGCTEEAPGGTSTEPDPVSMVTDDAGVHVRESADAQLPVSDAGTDDTEVASLHGVYSTRTAAPRDIKPGG